MRVGIALPGAAANLAIGAGQQRADVALRQIDRVAGGSVGRRETQVGVGQDAVNGTGTAEGIAQLAEQLLDLGRADMRLTAFELVEVVRVERQARFAGHPAAQRIEADRQQLRLGEGGRGDRAGVHADRAIVVGDSGLVVGIDVMKHAGVEIQPRHRIHQPLGRIQPFRQPLGTAAKLALKCSQLRQLRGDARQLSLPIGVRRINAGGIPGILGVNLGPRGNGVCHDDLVLCYE
jgi:hypothetical protein